MAAFARETISLVEDDLAHINWTLARRGKDDPAVEVGRNMLAVDLSRLGACFSVFGDPVQIGPDGRLTLGSFTLIGRGPGYFLEMTRRAQPSRWLPSRIRDLAVSWLSRRMIRCRVITMPA